MASGPDALTSSTLKHLRERWWDDAFTAFLAETLRPKPGRRLLDVGCGVGTAEAALARLRLTQIQLVGVDLQLERVSAALKATRGMNARVAFAAADAAQLPFEDASFDSTFCVAVLQHVRDVPAALAEFARVTKPGGRILAVEPDNAARYWFSSVESGTAAFMQARRFFAAAAAARGDHTEGEIGPRLAAQFVAAGIEPLSVHVFPVVTSHLGGPPDAVWAARRDAVRAEIARSPHAGVEQVGDEYLRALDRYHEEAASAGPAFVEIQNTLLFAAVGQREHA